MRRLMLALAALLGVVLSAVARSRRLSLPVHASPYPHRPLYAPVGATVRVYGERFGVAEGQITLAGVTCEVLSWSVPQAFFRVPGGVTSGYVGVWSGGICSDGMWFGVGQ